MPAPFPHECPHTGLIVIFGEGVAVCWMCRQLVEPGEPVPPAPTYTVPMVRPPWYVHFVTQMQAGIHQG